MAFGCYKKLTRSIIEGLIPSPLRVKYQQRFVEFSVEIRCSRIFAIQKRSTGSIFIE
jgi:hypothetical protein